MPQFGLTDYPIQDGAVRDALDQDVITPLQGLTGGVWGLGSWRRYLLSDLAFSARTVGSVLTVPKSAGSLSITKIGDYTMLFSLNVSTPMPLAGVNSTYLQLQLPDGITYLNRNQVSPEIDSSGCIQPCLIFDSVAGWDTGYIDPGFFSPGLVHFANPRGAGGVFTAGRSYNIFGQWAMEVAVAEHRT
jgi:hypothetical protein